MTPPIRTGPDGKRYPLRGGGGKGPTKSVVAGGVALAVWASGGGAGGVSVGGLSGGGMSGSSAGSSAMSAAESATVRSIRTNLPKARKQAKRGKRDRAWRRLKLTKGRSRVHEALECAALSYGRVQEFFVENPCRDLRRVQFPVSYQGGTISVLVSRVRMPSARQARQLQHVIDEHGSGDIRPVLPTVRFTGYNYHSDRDRRTVVVAETEPAAGSVPEPILESTARAAVTITAGATS